MDSKGFNFFIGLFVITGIIGIFAIGLWLARMESAEDTTPYVIYFEESVSGLNVGSRVSYRGIPIGTVSSIGIRKDDPAYVLVMVAIKDLYQIHQGDVATLKLEGITGSSYINIEGAERGSTPLRSSPEEPAVIPSQKSDLQQLVQGIPGLISEASVLMNRFAALLDQQNRERITAILHNIDTVSADLASQGDRFETTLTTINSTGQEIIRLSRSIEAVVTRIDSLVIRLDQTAGNVDELVSTDTRNLFRQWGEAARSLRTLTDSAQTLLADNKGSLEYFSQEGLYQLTLFLREARMLVAGLTRVVDRIESSGARFLLDQSSPEIKPQ